MITPFVTTEILEALEKQVAEKRSDAANARKDWAEQNRGQILAELELARIVREKSKAPDVMAITRSMCK